MADFTKFRTSIGGFNRDDVVHYIETASVEHLKELRQVKDANEKLEAEKAALRAELDETKKKLTAANAKLNRMPVEDASRRRKSRPPQRRWQACRSRRCASQRTSRTTRKHRRKCPLCPLRRGIIRKRSWKPTAGRRPWSATRSCARSG